MDHGETALMSLMASSHMVPVTIDTAGPSATISLSPGAVVNTVSVAFEFTSPDGASGFQCELTGGASSQSTAPAWANCTSPK